MPEITQAEMNQFHRYQRLGLPDEVEKKIKDLESDNGRQRDEIRGLKEKLPKDGEVVLPKAEAELIPRYKELGTPEEIKGKVEKGEQAARELASHKTRETAARFAQVAGIHPDAVDTLVALPQLSGATFEIRKGKVTNEKNQEVDGDVPYIKLAGENQTAMKYSEALDKVPGLKGLRPVDKKTTQGSTFTQQAPPSSGAPSSNLYDDIRKEVKEKYAPKQGQEQPTPPAQVVAKALGMA